jgi:hypothetical protein
MKAAARVIEGLTAFLNARESRSKNPPQTEAGKAMVGRWIAVACEMLRGAVHMCGASLELFAILHDDMGSERAEYEQWFAEAESTLRDNQARIHDWSAWSGVELPPKFRFQAEDAAPSGDWDA